MMSIRQALVITWLIALALPGAGRGDEVAGKPVTSNSTNQAWPPAYHLPGTTYGPGTTYQLGSEYLSSTPTMAPAPISSTTLEQLSPEHAVSTPSIFCGPADKLQKVALDTAVDEAATTGIEGLLTGKFNLNGGGLGWSIAQNYTESYVQEKSAFWAPLSGEAVHLAHLGTLVLQGNIPGALAEATWHSVTRWIEVGNTLCELKGSEAETCEILRWTQLSAPVQHVPCPGTTYEPGKTYGPGKTYSSNPPTQAPASILVPEVTLGGNALTTPSTIVYTGK